MFYAITFRRDIQFIRFVTWQYSAHQCYRTGQYISEIKGLWAVKTVTIKTTATSSFCSLLLQPFSVITCLSQA